jgi:hypothetical protein
MPGFFFFWQIILSSFNIHYYQYYFKLQNKKNYHYVICKKYTDKLFQLYIIKLY